MTLREGDTIIEAAQRRLDDLHNQHPTSEMAEAAQLMIQQLDIALHGQTWTRPTPPRTVWLQLLGEVQMAADRAGAW